MATFDKFVWVGFGSIATALMELFNIEDAFYNIPNIIIEPKFINHTELFVNRDVKHIQTELTRDNHKQLLKDINKNTLVIDLSDGVDSLMLLEWVKNKGSFFINASVENYYSDENHIHPANLEYKDIKKDTLFHRQLEVDKLMKNTRKSRFVSAAINPGGIQQFLKMSLRLHDKHKNIKMIKGNYAKLAHDLGLKEVKLSEYDSQKTKLKPTPTYGLNTWGVQSLCLEASDEVVMVLNNETIEDMEKHNIKLIKPDEGGKKANNIRFLAERGMDVHRSSVCLDHDGNPFQYDGGSLVSHAEITSLGQFLEYNGDTPTIMYIYRVCDVAQQTLNYCRKNKYQPLKENHVLELNEIENGGFDSIGCYLTFNDGAKMWCGTVASKEDTIKAGFKIANATAMQTAGWMWAFINFMIKYPDYGLNEGETIKHKFLFKYATPYLGNIFCKML
jgi:homospermidine synthase